MTQMNALASLNDPGGVRSGREARLLYRGGSLAPFTQTTGMAMGFMQGSPVIVPGDLALDFLTFCQRNPKPCPVIGVSERGSPALPSLGEDIDVRTDIGGYRIWRHGELQVEYLIPAAPGTQGMMVMQLQASCRIERSTKMR